jgi:dUTP pyrophosphatase
VRQDSIQVQVTIGEGGSLPSYATEGAAGVDIRCAEAVELAPMQRKVVPTGLKMAIPVGYEGQIRPRSGLAIKHGISMVNTPGTIDSDYRGEIGVILVNLGADTVRFEKGERIAQMVFCPIARADLVNVEALDDTVRGEGGFGSTGNG